MSLGLADSGGSFGVDRHWVNLPVIRDGSVAKQENFLSYIRQPINTFSRITLLNSLVCIFLHLHHCSLLKKTTKCNVTPRSMPEWLWNYRYVKENNNHRPLLESRGGSRVFLELYR
jgi:hypothetical protein